MDKNYEYHRFFNNIMNKWYYILVSLILSIICAYLYLTVSIPLYRATASIKLEDKKSELAELITIKNIYDRSSKSETEKFILSSRNVLTKAIHGLDHPVTFYVEDRYHRQNIYPLRPLVIDIDSLPENTTSSTFFTFEPIDKESFRLTSETKNSSHQGRFSYNRSIRMQGYSFKILSPPTGKTLKKVYNFRVNPVSESLTTVSNSLKIEDNLNTNILNLSFTDANPLYAKDMLNSILTEYQKYDRNQRSLSMKQISFYIDTLLQRMSLVLQKSGMEMQNFKTGNQMLNLSANADALITQITSLETEKHELSLRNLLNKQLRKALEKDPELNTLNFNTTSIYDPQLNNLLNKYNVLIDKKSDALINYPPTSVYMLRLEEQIAALKREVISNIENQSRKDEVLVSYLNKQIGYARKGIQSAPKLERNYITLQSEFNINQKVYNYLSEKKLEAEIATAAVIPNAQLIDEAAVDSKPIYPVESSVYKDFGIAGILLGAVFLFIAQKLDSRLYEVSVIEENTTTPIIGTISRTPKAHHRQDILVMERPRSLFAESVRAMRANLLQLITNHEGTVICITSAIAGEGKSFTSLNLAGTLSMTQKKVLLVATDLRKSALHETFQGSNQTGLSSFLHGEADVANLCQQTRYPYLDFISAGPLPANPAELLQSVKMQELMTVLRNRYDFIILDTAPVGLVADSVPLMSLADINLFVLRHGISSTSSITLPDKLKKEFKLKHMAIVLNNFRQGHTPKGYYSLSTDIKSYSDYDKVKSN